VSLQSLILIVFGGIFYILMSVGGIGWLGQQFPQYWMAIANAVNMAIGIYFILLLIAIFSDIRGKFRKPKEDPPLEKVAFDAKNHRLLQPEISKKFAAKKIEVPLTKDNNTKRLRPDVMFEPSKTASKKFPEEKLVELQNLGALENDTVLSGFGSFPNAALSIEYRNELAEAWSRVEKLPAELVLEFLNAIETDPKLSVGPLEESIMEKYNKSLSPFENEELTQCYLEVKNISDEAANEFIKVVELLGDTLSPDDIKDKIRKKFST
jgi:hypothetical protein